MTTFNSVLILLLVSGCSEGHPVTSTHRKVGDPCTPPNPGHVRVICGESELVDEAMTELSVEDGYGVNVCQRKRVYETQTYSFSYKRRCSRSYCYLVCKKDGGSCSNATVNTTKEEVGCCDGFGIDPTLVPASHRHRGSISDIASTNGCPISLLESVLHSLLSLGMLSFVVELSSLRSGLVDRLWPRQSDSIEETFTVFGFSDEEFGRFSENLLSNSAISRAVVGHIIPGTIYSFALTHRTILTPLEGNFSIHVSTVVTPFTKDIYLNGARINQTDAFQARNGIVHVMESFIPLTDMTVIEVLQSQSDRFSTFSKLLDEVNVIEHLSLNSKSRSRTILALTNAAFEDLPTGTVECLLQEENRRQLRKFVLIHIAHPTEYSSTLSQRAALHTFSRYSLLVTVEEDTTISLTRKMIKIEEPDIPASNGVVHVLSEPIVPFNITALCS